MCGCLSFHQGHQCLSMCLLDSTHDSQPTLRYAVATSVPYPRELDSLRANAHVNSVVFGGGVCIYPFGYSASYQEEVVE